jgi:hypothetical protein
MDIDALKKGISAEIGAAQMHADGSCKNQWIHHVMVHEAGHAIFASRRGIPFVDVQVYPPKQVNDQLGANNWAHAGGLQLVEADPTKWIPEDPDAALDVLLAGTLAERFLLACYLDRAYEGDQAMWAQGMGTDRQGARALLESSMPRVWMEMSRCFEQIEMVVLEFQRQLIVQLEEGAGFTHPLVLTEDAVSSLVTKGSPAS